MFYFELELARALFLFQRALPIHPSIDHPPANSTLYSIHHTPPSLFLHLPCPAHTNTNTSTHSPIHTPPPNQQVNCIRSIRRSRPSDHPSFVLLSQVIPSLYTFSTLMTHPMTQTSTNNPILLTLTKQINK